MTAIREIDVLRAHAVSVSAPLGRGHAPETDRCRQPHRSRPVLVMCWRVMPDGRLACHWQTDISGAFGLPPD
jgi:hypothetical protein